MKQNELSAYRLLREGVKNAAAMFETLANGRAPDDVKLLIWAAEQRRNLQLVLDGADEHLGREIPPTSHTQLARWARVALLNLAGDPRCDVQAADIENAKARLRLIVDAIEQRPATPPQERVNVSRERTEGERIAAFANEHTWEWFIGNDGEIRVLEHCFDARDAEALTHSLPPLTLIHVVRTLDEAHAVLLGEQQPTE